MAELTADKLCDWSGLTADGLAMLESASLLRPTRTWPEPLFRPKLASWARKLAYLLDTGWTLTEIKRWTRSKPNAWPPENPSGDNLRV